MLVNHSSACKFKPKFNSLCHTTKLLHFMLQVDILHLFLSPTGERGGKTQLKKNILFCDTLSSISSYKVSVSAPKRQL